MLVEMHRFIVLEYDAESKGSFSPGGGRVVLKNPCINASLILCIQVFRMIHLFLPIFYIFRSKLNSLPHFNIKDLMSFPLYVIHWPLR